MKLAPFITKYLTLNKQLNLPGLGSFYAGHSENADGVDTITFEEKKVDAFDEDLVEFISKETGKMKPLALSDLQSQVDYILEFVNTGKPYHIAGIGSILRTQKGHIEYYQEKKIVAEPKLRREMAKNETNIMPLSYISHSPKKPQKSLPIIIILLLSVLTIAALGWYFLRTPDQQTNVVSSTPANSPVLTSNDTTIASTSVNTPVESTVAQYKYVIETAKQPRADRRFNQLKNLNWPVELEAIDSATYRIVMKLPAAGSDTTRVKDSLRILSGRKVFIIQ